jgi:hypothetical protein
MSQAERRARQQEREFRQRRYMMQQRARFGRSPVYYAVLQANQAIQRETT